MNCSMLFSLVLVSTLLVIQSSAQNTSSECSNKKTVYTSLRSITNKNVYNIMIDAGSTGSRLYVFRFRRANSHTTGLHLIDSFKKSVRPGLSSFRSKEQVSQSLTALRVFAESKIPSAKWNDTGILIRATAGLRLLPPNRRRKIIFWATDELRKWNFKGKVENPVRILSGLEEAQYGWITMNTLSDTFDLSDASISTKGMLDMGGGSMQICFAHRQIPKDAGPSDSHFITLGGKEFVLHCKSFLGLGYNAAAMSMFGYDKESPPAESEVLTSPCLASNFKATFQFGQYAFNVSGENNRSSDAWRECMASAEDAIEAMNVTNLAEYVKNVDFIAKSQFFFQAMGLGKKSTDGRKFRVKEYLKKAKKVCANPKTKGKFAPYNCLFLSVIYSLLNKLGFADDKMMYSANKIKGFDSGWPLGAAIHYLTEERGPYMSLSLPENYLAPPKQKLKVICRLKGSQKNRPTFRWNINGKIFKIDKTPVMKSKNDYLYTSTVYICPKCYLKQVTNIVKCTAIEKMPKVEGKGCTPLKTSSAITKVTVELPTTDCRDYRQTKMGKLKCSQLYEYCILRNGIFTAYSKEVCCCQKNPAYDQ